MDTSKVDRTQAVPDPTVAQWFAGDVRFQPLVRGRDVELLAVFFAAGARTRPHIHQDDQVVYFVEGRGGVAAERELTPTTAGGGVADAAGGWGARRRAAEPPAAANLCQRGAHDQQE